MRRAVVLGLGFILIIGLASPARAIVYGEPDGNRHPNVGALVAEFGDPEMLRPFCSGTLVASDVFLTAAHCIQSLEAFEIEEFWVTFDNVVDEDADLLTGTAHVAEGANAGGFSDPLDLAVIVLDDPVGLTPAAVPTRAIDRATLRTATFTAVGYGAVREERQGGLGAILDNAERRFATQSFLSLQRAWLVLSMNEATGDGGTCYGDSGGPHFLGGVESNFVVSITVTGDAVCKATDKTYRLDTPRALEFLAEFV